MTFCAFAREMQCPQNFGEMYINKQTDRRFLKMVKSCSGHLKTCKSTKNRMSKIFANPILSSRVYTEESKKESPCILRIKELHHSSMNFVRKHKSEYDMMLKEAYFS